MKNLFLLLAVSWIGAAMAQVEIRPPRPLPAPLSGDGSPLGPAPVPSPSAGPAGVPNPLVIQPPGPIPPPLPDDPFAGPPSLLPDQEEGWYFTDELLFAFPTLTNQLPSSAPFRVPQVALQTTFGFHTEIGYRFAEDEGLVALGYRLLNAEGTGTVNQSRLDLSTKTRLASNVIDLDYGVLPYEIVPRWTASWRLGGRLASLYFDSRGVTGDFVIQGSNNYLGSGLHAQYELQRRIAWVQGLSIFGRADGAFLIGETQQRYRTELRTSVALLTAREQRNVPTLNAQLGLIYRPSSIPGLSFTLGYTYEQWFRIGSLGLAGDGSIATRNGSFSWHGPFVRGQFDF
ncbi:MAG: Lpg1974 family pore-forming outer membrane protein [Gemmataceae bacterium]